jgi:hypothetical protein
MTKIKLKYTSIDEKKDFLEIEFKNKLLIEIENTFLNISESDTAFVRNAKNDKQAAIWYGDLEYKYGNYTPLIGKEFTENMKILSNLISSELELDKDFFNSCYVNRYNNGGIGRHHDNDKIFKSDKSWAGGKEIIVAVFSLGGKANIFIFKDYYDNHVLGNVEAIDNSLYVMNKNFQNRLYHQVGASMGIRYSFTFRHTVKNIKQPLSI